MPVPSGPTPSVRLLLRNAVYERLLAAILDGTLAPGERIRDAELAAWLGASRTPVREALASLEHEELVESAPNRYTRVSPLSRQTAAEGYQVMAALHGLAARLAAGRADESRVAMLRAESERFDWAVWRSDVGEAVAAHAALHESVLGASGNGQLGRIAGRLALPLRRMEWQTWPLLRDSDASAQHARLAAALEAADAEEAAEAARDEWTSLGRRVAEALRQAERRSSVEISSR
jgi:DNA-binding GntR family transcriptional regulator